MYGFEKHDPTRTLESLFDSDDQVRVWREVGPLAQETGFASYEAIHRRVDGTTFPVQAEAVRIPDLDNQPTWVISVHDLTERRQVEVLRARSTELETENHHVQETSRLKSEFLANMSHELRTPLNSILGFSELLHNGEVGALSEQQRDFVGDIHTSGKHLLRLINDILDLSKVEAGKLDFYPEETTLTAVAGEVVAVLRGVAHAAAVHVDVTIEPAIDAVYLDTSRLKQVLYNYISNAIKFTPAGGRVRVMAHRENATCFRLEVADDGPGISPENLSRLFTEFEQLDAGRTKSHGGTGLGLALTRRLVEAQRGSVGVDSVEGKGCVFFAVLPVRSSFPSLLPQPSRIAGSKSDAPRILVVEDDAADQMQIVTLLLAAGYAVDTAATAAHALQSMQEWTYDAITLDLLLPDGNGFEILRAVRRRPGYEHVPVIVISMVASQVTAAFAVQEVLQKPLNDADLVAALARTSVWPPGPVLVVDDDDASARLMTSSLAQIGLEVAVANNGIDGLQRALERTPSAVILDLVMPGMDGFGFLREFRRRAEWTHVPVLIWTTKDLTADERTRLLQSANGVLAKDGAGGVALLDAIREHLPHVRRVR
jgi:signal transduction histidine kinase/CheY-like chemotaxis protein